jgi:vanillate/4-hydroxybenzoate decarboxylase subunit C
MAYPYQDLRGFLSALDDAGQLLRIDDKVAPEPDLAAAAAAAPKLGESAPALLFTNVSGFESPKIALNVHGSWANHAIALGLAAHTPVREQVEVLGRRWQRYPVEIARRKDPPFAANAQEGDEVSVFDVLPLFRLNAGDGGFYIDKAAIVSRDPDDPDNFGKQNVGIYRLQVKGPNKLGIQPAPQHDIAVHLTAAEQRGEDLPVAIALGNDPSMSIVASTPLGYDQSEYEMAGALRGEPCPVTSAPLTGIDVPWGSEVVLEGVVVGRQREIEGPFGEFTGHYTGGRRMPVIRVDSICFRTDPIFEHLYLGMPWTELDYLIGPSTCLPLLEQLRAEFPEVQAVNAMYTHGLVAIISTGSRYGGYAKAVGMRAMTTRHGLGYCKVVIVVDEQVDPFDLPQVMWALSTKMNPAYDLVTLPQMPIMPLDPGAQPQGITHRIILDATTPAASENRGHYGHTVMAPNTTDSWVAHLKQLLRERAL